MTHETQTRAVGYVRVSTADQAQNGLSLDAQRARLSDFARVYQVDLVDVVEDAGASAGTLERPGLKRALKLLTDGQADALVVVKLDRLTRSVRGLADLLDNHFADGKAALMSVGEHIDTSSASGRMVLNILVTIGQWEREAIGERTAAALRHKRNRGEYAGGKVPFGHVLDDDGVTLLPHPDEQAAVTLARALRANGLPLRAVADELAKRGHVSRTGRPLSSSAVWRLTKGS